MPQDPVPVPESGSDPAVQRWLRVQRTIDACIDRRLQGETLLDSEIIAAHPDLMPELGLELQSLAVIEAARRRAGESAPVDRRETPAASGTLQALSRDFPEYEMLGELQRCGSRATCHAIHDASDREVALRIFGSVETARVEAFTSVVHDLTALNTARIVVPHTWGSSPSGAFFVVTDFVVGDLLVDRLRRDLQCGDPAPAAEVFATTAELLHVLHRRGITHGRLPDNVLVDRDGHPHILDCGMAVLLGDDFSDDPRQDVAGLGAALAEALGAALSSPHFEIAAIVQKSTAEDPRQRYANAGDLAVDVRRWLAGEHVEACRQRPGYVWSKNIRRGIRRFLRKST